MLAYNAVMTWLARPAKYEEPIHSAPRLSNEYEDAPPPKSDLEGAPVLGVGIALDAWSKFAWHRTWERLPVKFTVMVTLAVVIATLFEVIPTFLIRSNVPTIATVAPYTPLELAGREIYISEGCYNCHSQQIRPTVAETKRYGDYSKPGEFVYDHPFQWGSRRIGPDLAREGGRQSHDWHWRHLENPTAVSDGSIMPSYLHLLEKDINYSSLRKIVKTAHLLGANYPQEILDGCEEHAKQQALKINAEMVSQGGQANVFNKQAIALIAYLQRMGTDLTRPPTPTPQSTPPAETPAAVAANP
jgi:cytochrome c oxidase cbb3-type subunit I/II